MRDVDPDILAALRSGDIRPFLLIKATIAGSVHLYTDCDIPIEVEADLYKPRGLRMEKISYSIARMVDSVRLRLDNLDDVLTPDFTGGMPQGAPLQVAAVVLDAQNFQPIGAVSKAVVIFEGEIGDWDLDETEVMLAGANQFSRWSQRTLSNYSANCRWKLFKGPECLYAGAETWCDRSYVRCQALANVANFGGQRFLPYIQDKEIWWGEVPGDGKT